MGKIKIRPSDKLFSEFIRSRDGWTCQRCKKKYDKTISSNRMALHCSHFQGRGKESTRFYELNADAMCYGCHQYFTSHPGEHLAWQVETKGQETIDAIILLSNSYKKRNDKEEAAYWRKKLQEMVQ